MAPYWEEALHSLKGLPNVIDIRNTGLVGAVEFAPSPAGAGKRGFAVFQACWERGALVRAAADNIALSPPLIIERQHIDRLIGILGDAIRAAAT